MAATTRPDDDDQDDESGSGSGSVPGEYLAEFLTAVMRRQYGVALEYCRLILRYEPSNAAARALRPLLRRRARAALSPSHSSPDDCSDLSLDSSVASALSGSGSERDSPRALSPPPPAATSAALDTNGNELPPPPDSSSSSSSGGEELDHNDNCPLAAAALRRLRAHFTRALHVVD